MGSVCPGVDFMGIADDEILRGWWLIISGWREGLFSVFRREKRRSKSGTHEQSFARRRL